MRIAVAMSGGVDSSVAALMLQRAGHDVVGVHLVLRSSEMGGRKPSCISVAQAGDAELVAGKAGFPFRILELTERFETEVIDPFVEAYRSGETPNPCVRCNSHVKFGPMLKWARAGGFDKVATGHYARVDRAEDTGRWRLLRGCNRRKDQSYFLTGLSQEQLAMLCLPLGAMAKEETRQRAREWGIPVAEKPDSQDICLVADKDYRSFLTQRRGGGLGEEGPIVDTSGAPRGRHRGLAGYTVGQRRGLGVSHTEPLYVVAIRPEANTLVVGAESEIYSDRLRATSVNWVSMEPPADPLRAGVQIRYQNTPGAAGVSPLGRDEVEVVFDSPQRAVAPGQIAVFYDGEVLLGGGRIRRAPASSRVEPIPTR